MTSQATSFAAPLVLLLLLLLSSAGWGALLLRPLTFRSSPAPFFSALSLVAGLSVLAWLLQWLACFQLFTPGRATGILLAGCCLLPFLDPHAVRILAGRKLSAATITAVAVSALIVFIPPALNTNDDTRAYILFSLKIKALGGIGWEPFSERRLFSLGAHYPLQALTLSWLPVNRLGLIEPTLGVVLLVLTAATLSTPFQALLCAALLWLTVLSGSRFLANLSPMYLMIPPLLLILRASQDQLKIRPGLAVILGLISGFAISLRPTVAPFAALILLWTLVRAGESSAGRNLLAAALGAAFFTLPFSLDLLRSGGTLLFPILGRGFHASAAPNAATIASLTPLSGHLVHMLRLPATDPFLLFAAALVIVALRSLPPNTRANLIAAAGAALVTCEIIAYQTSGTNAARYWAPTVLALSLHCVITSKPPPFSLRRVGLAGLAVAILLLISPMGATLVNSAVTRLATRKTILAPSKAEIAAYRNLQDAVPPGATILACLNRNDLLDLRRNRILVNDQPGMTGPPPGWPREKSGLRFARYLRSQGIDYVAMLRDPNPEATRADLTRPLRDWEGIVNLAYAGVEMALGDVPFRDSIVFQTDSMLLYRVP